MSDKFKKKVVWITGGGSGIGRALALEFARQGALLALSGRRAHKLAAVVSEVKKLGTEAIAVPCDVTCVTDIEHAVDDIIARFGQLDVAIANSGYSVRGTVEKLTAEDWRRQLDTNVIGLAMTIKSALPYLRETKGRIVLMGSVAGVVGLPGTAAYSASKFAVRGIGESLTAELAGTGVSCTTILPGFVESEIGQVDNQGVFSEEREDKRPKKIMWTADRAARDMIPAIALRKAEHIVTGHGKIAVTLSRLVPSVVRLAMRESARRGFRRD